MPFPIERKYIEESEIDLSILFPTTFISKMMAENGGEVSTEDDDWALYPFFDKSDNKRISRTNNHIVLETKKAKEWDTFPKGAVAIGTNGSGDHLILLPDRSNTNLLLDTIYIWSHETGNISKVANSILDLVDS
jgi:hypothetical protein